MCNFVNSGEINSVEFIEWKDCEQICEKFTVHIDSGQHIDKQYAVVRKESGRNKEQRKRHWLHCEGAILWSELSEILSKRKICNFCELESWKITIMSFPQEIADYFCGYINASMQNVRFIIKHLYDDGEFPHERLERACKEVDQIESDIETQLQMVSNNPGLIVPQKTNDGQMDDDRSEDRDSLFTHARQEHLRTEVQQIDSDIWTQEQVANSNAGMTVQQGPYDSQRNDKRSEDRDLYTLREVHINGLHRFFDEIRDRDRFMSLTDSQLRVRKTRIQQHFNDMEKAHVSYRQVCTHASDDIYEHLEQYFMEIMAFIEDRLKMLSGIEQSSIEYGSMEQTSTQTRKIDSTSNRFKPYEKNGNRDKSHKNKDKSNSKTKSSAAESSTECIVPDCKQSHPAWRCDVFQSLRLSERRELTNQHRLCRCCLSKGHTSVNCQRKGCGNCPETKLKHHLKMCPKHKHDNGASANVANQNPGTSTQ